MNPFRLNSRLSLKILFLFGWTISICGNSFAQSFGNEWIVPGQDYLRISVFEDGFYSLTGQDLQDAGFNTTAIVPQNLQVWHRGKEMAVILKDAGDGSFDASDSLIFYGLKNDGILDSLLYQPNNSQPHKYFNLHSDTSEYYLTVGSSPGKRIGLAQQPANGALKDWFWEKRISVFTETYNRGQIFGETRLSYFTYGEGWTGQILSKAPTAAPVQKTFEIPVDGILSTGPHARLEILFSGMNDERHNLEVIVGDPAAPIGSLPVEAFQGNVNRKFLTNVPLAYINGPTLKVTVKVNGGNSYTDRVSVSYIKLEYPKSLSFPSGVASKLYFENSENTQILVPVDSGLEYFDISDLYKIKKLPSSSELGLYQGNITLLSTPQNQYKQIHKLETVNLDKYSIVSSSLKNSDFLIITHPRFLEQAEQYAQYRQSPEGGAFQTDLVVVQELFDAFSYGEFTPLAIRNYCRFMAEYAKPKYLFIIGRGVDVDYNHYRIRKWYRFNPEAYLAENTWDYMVNFVPHAGTPTSDLVYVNGLSGKPEYVAGFPVGRLNAKYPQEVSSYLNKVKQHEALDSDLPWRKNILHLSGGKTSNEIKYFKETLENAKPIAEDTVWGGKIVKHISKTEGSYVQDELIETVAEEVNKGVSYITFLGHDSPSVPDVDIGYISNKLYGYNNYGKYPMLMLNGCNTVNASVPYSLAENWLQTENVGAILTMGHTDYAHFNLLGDYIKLYYKHAFSFRDVFENGLSAGDIQVKVHEDLDNGADVFKRSMQQQVMIMGDPSIKIYNPNKPDFSIQNVHISSFDNLPVSAVSDSFNLSIQIRNFGISSGKSVQVLVERNIGTRTYIDTFRVNMPLYEETINFSIRNNKEEQGFGLNRFSIRLDAKNEVDELDEQNNSYNFQYFIPSSSIMPLLPEKYSIVNTSVISLIAQSNDLMLENKEYVFEIDTSFKFDSPYKKEYSKRGDALVAQEVSIGPSLLNRDSLVFFWRVRLKDSQVGEDTVWATSSFTFINNGQEGWSQSKLSQINEGITNDVSIDLEDSRYMFLHKEATITASSPGKNFVGPDVTQPSIYYTELGLNGDGIVFENRGNCREGILAITMSKSDLVPYFPADLNNICGWQFSGKRINSFTNLAWSTDVTSGQFDLIRYIDGVKSGDYVLLMSSGNAHYDKWTDDLKNKLVQAFGVNLLDSLKPNMPYMVLAKKDSLEPIFERYSGDTDKIDYTLTLEGRAMSGTIKSPLIGPAMSWSEGNYEINRDVGDSYKISIIGYSQEGISDTLLADIQSSPFDLSGIDAQKYPYIQFYLHLTDSVKLTPAYLKSWQILYKGVPEGTMDPLASGKAQYLNIEKQEGDSLNLTYTFTNISTRSFSDSILVRFEIKNQERGIIISDSLHLDSLPSGESLTFEFKKSTLGMVGNNSLIAFVNPEVLPELSYSNNIIETEFQVTRDKLNPILDVTFDGIHLMDGEIVSPSPLINISVRDENQFLIREDTTGVEIFLKENCSGCSYQKINFSDPEIIYWGQANARSNNFKVEYKPDNLADGTYSLRVQARDVSGNISGLLPYEISFEVINESSITNFYPYPNPFSTNTRFVFTLTGNKVPDDINISIMTVTGKVVRQIRKAELGPLRIGNNISDFSWDGRDQFGDQLANGVYLYKVDIKDGDQFSHRETKADKAFHKGFGKIYLLK